MDIGHSLNMNLIKIEIYETVKARLKARADTTIKNNKGKTPLQFALQRQHMGMIGLITQSLQAQNKTQGLQIFSDRWTFV